MRVNSTQSRKGVKGGIPPLQGQGTASLVGFGATPQPFRVKPTQRKKSTRRRQRSVPASNFARPQTRPPSCFIDPLCSVAPNGRDHIACPPLSAQTKPSRRIANILPLGFQSYLTPLLHICHIPNPPRKHQQLPGRKSCEKNASVTVSRVLSRDDHLSRPDVAAQAQAMPRTRRAAACVLIRILHQMGFTARTSRQAVGELLPRLSILTAPKCGGISLLHSPWSRLHRPLAGILPCGARTFLIPLLARDRLITSHRCIIAQKARFVKGRLLTQNARCAIMDASIWVEDENHETLYRNAPDTLFCAPDDGGFRGRGCP